MRLADILDMTSGDVSRLTAKELSKVNTYLRANVRSRVSRLEKYEKAYGIESPALRQFRKEGPLTIGENLNQKRNEFQRLSKFLKYKTSTITGLDDYREDIENKVGEGAFESNFWEMYEEFKEKMIYKYGFQPSDTVLKAFSEAYNGEWKNKEDLFKKAEKIYSEGWDDYINDLAEDFWDFEEENEDGNFEYEDF